MPVERIPISRDQFCELLGVDPKRFINVERAPCLREDQRQGQGPRVSTGLVLVLEPEERMQTTGTCPPLSDNVARKPKSGKKRGQ